MTFFLQKYMYDMPKFNCMEIINMVTKTTKSHCPSGPFLPWQNLTSLGIVGPTKS